LTDLEAVQSFPYAFLVDRSGTVVWEGHPKDNDLAGAVERLFIGNEPPAGLSPGGR